LEDALESLLGTEITDETDLVADLRELAKQRHVRALTLRGGIYEHGQVHDEKQENPKELQEQIRITVIHELAHYFGFDEEHLVELGLD
jgi:predicted Zn-dependent protease with MMP-like domain